MQVQKPVIVIWKFSFGDLYGAWASFLLFLLLLLLLFYAKMTERMNKCTEETCMMRPIFGSQKILFYDLKCNKEHKIDHSLG